MTDCTATAPLIFENLTKSIADPSLDWQPLREGIEIARVYSTTSEGPAAGFVRFAAGAVLPRHHHAGYEHILVLRGSQQDDHGDHQAGSLLIHPPGTSHRVVSREGCLVFAYWEKPIEFDATEEL